MDISKFLMNGLVDSLNNGLLAPELVTVYAGNYVAKSLMTTDDLTTIQTAITTYQANQAELAKEAEAQSESESTSDSTSEATSETAS